MSAVQRKGTAGHNEDRAFAAALREGRVNGGGSIDVDDDVVKKMNAEMAGEAYDVSPSPNKSHTIDASASRKANRDTLITPSK